MSVGYTAPAEASHGEVVVVVVIIENVFTVHKTADTFVGAHPNISCLVLTDGLYVGVSQSAFTLVYFVVSVCQGGEAYQTFTRGHPQPLSAVFVESIDGIGGEFGQDVEELDALELRVIEAQASSEESYPYLVFGILQHTAGQIVLQIVVCLDCLAVTIYKIDTFAGSDPNVSLLVFMKGTYVSA